MTILAVKEPLPILKNSPVLWRKILRESFTQIASLMDFLELTPEQRKSIITRANFPLNLPRRLAEKIQKGTLDDPILRQFVPTKDEVVFQQGFGSDPVGDEACRKAPKLLHKYEGRVLLVSTSACAMHCRYCFRQHFDYETQDKTFTSELQEIAKNPSIQEVILSGGDPLSLSDEKLQGLLEGINSIPHVTRIRFHTRFPIGIPERIDDSFLDMLSKVEKQIWFVIHVNHPLELDSEVLASLRRLQKSGCTILNQSVLLKGVNDSVETLKELSEVLIDHGIMPYYLHQLDRVQGAAHFEVEESTGHRLIKELSNLLPGYGVPKYVKEVAGEQSKVLLGDRIP